MGSHYIVEPKLPPEPRRPIPGKGADIVEQVIVGQFPLSFNVSTGVFALGGSRLTAHEWVNLRTRVDDFLEHNGLLDKLEVHDFRPSLSKRVITVLRWLTRR